jgi:hypothetical protein
MVITSHTLRRLLLRTGFAGTCLAAVALLTRGEAEAAPRRSPSESAGKTAPTPVPPAPEAEPEPEPEPEVQREPAEPEVPPEPEPEPEPTSNAEVGALMAESRALQDELVRAKAAVSTVTAKLFRAKVSLSLRSNLERFYEVSELSIALDGAPVFVQAKGLPPARQELALAYAAPGAHEIGVSLELKARRDATYRLRIDQSFTIVVPEDSTVSSALVLRETGNMWRAGKRGRGRHAVTTVLRIKTKPNERGAKRRARTSASASGGTP